MNEETKQTLCAVAIARVSTSNQGVFGDSSQDQFNQIELIRRKTESDYHCELKIIKTFDFTESASVDLESQPMQKALSFIRQSETPIRFAFVLCIDRFTRAGAVVYSQLKAEFAKLGVTLVDTRGVIGTKEFNTLEHLGAKFWWSITNPNAKNELLEAEDSKNEVSRIQTRMIGAAIRLIQTGFWRGSTPLGFVAERIVMSDGKRRFVLKSHPEESKWFTKMFELKADGVLTDQEIVDEINKMGFITKPKKYRDKEDRSKIVKIMGNRKLTIKMLRNYIQKPIFAGVNTERWTTFQSQLHDGQPVYLNGMENGKGIVTFELFNNANQSKVMIIDENGRPKVYKGEIPNWQRVKLKDNPLYPYKKFILCPAIRTDGTVCRHPLKASSPQGKLKPIPTYHCALNHKYLGINAKKLEVVVEDFVKKVKFSDKFIYNFERQFLNDWEEETERLNRDNINWEKRVTELREQLTSQKDQLKMAKTEEGINTFEEEITKTKTAIAQATIERSKAEDQEIDTQTLINTAKYWMEHFPELVLNIPNRLHKATLFGKIFEESPTFEELKNGTPKLRQLFALNQAFNSDQNQLSGIDGTRTRNLFRDREAL